MSNPKAFTLKFNGNIARTLITECGVCRAFDPLSRAKHPEIAKFNGLWDTGATGSVISKNVVDALNLKPISKAKVFHANGESLVNVYAINLFLPNQVAFPFVKVTEGILNGFDILIGMDIITSGDFALTNTAGSTTFSFRVPSIEEIDYVKDKEPKSEPLKLKPSIGRNELCHCGSNKKFKHCHGKNL
jgi:predicted aspartyl protease